jgi:hypothetical protein
MEKFMYLFRGGLDETQSPEAMQAQMQKWVAWMQTLGQKQIMLGGEPLQSSGKKISGQKKVVTDGPFAEAKEMVGGYLIVNAKDLDHAVEISKDCPIFDMGGSVEIRPIRSMNM